MCVIAGAELQRARREPSVLLTGAAQPLLWLLVFGAAMSRARKLTTSDVSYRAFIVLGVLAPPVLFIAIFSGLSIVWDGMGITQRIPSPRRFHSAIIVGKTLGAGLRTLAQATVVLIVVAVGGAPVAQANPLAYEP